MLYEVLKTAKMGAGKAPDLYTALLANNLRRDGEVKTLSGIPPLTFPSNGQPLLDYLISGNTVQSGAPSPDSPVTPQGTGERTAQLYFKKIVGGSIGADGGILANASFDCYVAKVEANQQYIGTGYVYAFYTNEPALGSVSYNGQRVAASVANGFTAPIDGYVAVRHNTGVTNAMLNSGSTALPYEPYGYKIPISSNSTATPVYLGEVQTMRRVKKLVLTGEETNWINAGGNAPYRITLSDIVSTSDRDSILFLSTHYLAVSNKASWSQYNTCVSWAFSGNANVKCLQFRDINQATLTDFNSYLATQYANGTPVIVWYVLATEETAVVNEPLMKIGDYADTLSKAQAGVEIPTTKGSTTLDVETTVKPSEIYIKYKG